MKMHRSGQIRMVRRAVTCMLAVVSLIGYAGCVPVKFYKMTRDGKLDKKSEVGFEYFVPKSYLVISGSGEHFKAQVVTLPDPSKPRGMRFNRIWGHAKVELTSTDGVFTQFLADHDAKGPETLEQMKGLASAFPTSAGDGTSEAKSLKVKFLEKVLPTIDPSDLRSMAIFEEKIDALIALDPGFRIYEIDSTGNLTKIYPK